MSRASNPLRFVLRLALIYGTFLLSQNIPATARAIWRPVYDALGAMQARGVAGLFGLFGYDAGVDVWGQDSDFPASYVVRIENSPGVRLNYPCLAVDTTFALLALLMAYSAPLKSKLWAVPLAIAAVQGLNFARVAALTWMSFARPGWLEFSHHYAFQYAVVAVVFALFAWWVERAQIRPSGNLSS
ncbi:MAG: hypothetical protein RMM53_08130 [Bacteroidia bacterium]|nr:hypothetical protein [Bacteroidia bacterium]MDW8334165.1 hypothetical protein [Bacteroidia bacterium]